MVPLIDITLICNWNSNSSFRFWLHWLYCLVSGNVGVSGWENNPENLPNPRTSMMRISAALIWLLFWFCKWQLLNSVWISALTVLKVLPGLWVRQTPSSLCRPRFKSVARLSRVWQDTDVSSCRHSHHMNDSLWCDVILNGVCASQIRELWEASASPPCWRMKNVLC